MKLEIVIITYNRSVYLNKTLESLFNSCLKDCKITVLNNGSTDDTKLVAANYIGKFLNFEVVSHENNIGLGANIIRAFEITKACYTWVVCDDDEINLANFSDVLEVIESEQVELIHVGGHYQKEWKVFGGMSAPAEELFKLGYPYFKFSSFLPTNIVKTRVFQKDYLIPGYANVINAYPHMPFLFDIFLKGSPIYVSKMQIIAARWGGQSYSSNNWFYWWMRTCELLKSKKLVRAAFFDQWNDIKKTNREQAIKDFNNFRRNQKFGDYYIKHFISNYFSSFEKFESGKLYLKHVINRFKHRIENFQIKQNRLGEPM